MGYSWPLVFFTVLTQLTVGAFVYCWFVRRSATRTVTVASGGNSSGVFAPTDPYNTGLLILVVVQVVAIVAAVFHLGQPFAFYRALSGVFGTSWLSREVLFTGLFLLSLAALNFVEAYRRQAYAGPVTVILGVLAVACSGLIYDMPARPAWDSLWPMLSFFLTAWVAGIPLGMLVMATSAKGLSPGTELRGTVETAATRENGLKVSESGWFLLLVGIAVSVLFNAMYLSTLADGRAEAAATLAAILSSPVFWLRVVLGWLIPAGILLSRANRGLRTTLLLLALVVVGEILGRAVFYGSVVPMAIFQFK